MHTAEYGTQREIPFVYVLFTPLARKEKVREEAEESLRKKEGGGDGTF